MIDAARHIVGGEIMVDAEIIKNNWIQLDKDGKPNDDQKIFDMIFKKINEYKKLKGGQVLTDNMGRGAYV